MDISHGDTGRKLDCLCGVISGQQVSQAPAGLGVGSQLLARIGPIRPSIDTRRRHRPLGSWVIVPTPVLPDSFVFLP
jgi:hypothetical protein